MSELDEAVARASGIAEKCDNLAAGSFFSWAADEWDQDAQAIRRVLDALREAQEGHVKMTVYANQLEHQIREQAEEIERLNAQIKDREGEAAQVRRHYLHEKVEREKAEAELAAEREKVNLLADEWGVRIILGQLQDERERVQTMESRFWDAVQPWRERAERLHAVGEQFADDLDSEPSTHLLAVELRNRWRKAWEGGSDAIAIHD